LYLILAKIFDMEIKKNIEILLQYALKNKILENEDYFFTRNNLMALLKVNTVFEDKLELIENKSVTEILDPILNYAAEIGIIENNTISNRDNLDAQIRPHNYCP